jgi:hypothetical protein
MNSSMTIWITITKVKRVRRISPTILDLCGLALKVRMRYRRGVVRRCIDSSSAWVVELEGAIGEWKWRESGNTNTSVCDIWESYDSLLSRRQLQSIHSMRLIEGRQTVAFGRAFWGRRYRKLLDEIVN